LIVPLISFFF